MSLIAHLSDLHFGGHDRLQNAIHDGLISTLSRLGEKVDLLVMTGDVFDTSAPDEGVVEGFLGLYQRIEAALGGQVPALIIPGNHDRRIAGVFAPWSDELFKTLARRLAGKPHVRVCGTRTPFLAEWVDLPGVPADIVAYDSTFLPRGLVSAGGVVRQADLIELAGRLAARDPDRPLLFLVHHHLVPTPVTDTSFIDTKRRPVYERLLVSEVLPEFVANGDREELTMTALGAGSALSTLQQLGRAVLVLHGHKHYPTARLLSGVGDDEADLLITSAGSCGTATAFSGSDLEEAPRLWPSFNLLELGARSARVRIVAWSPWEAGRRNPPRLLLHAERAGTRWSLRRDASTGPAFEPVLSLNEAHYTLSRSRSFLERYDLQVKRTVRALPVAYMREHWDVVEGAPGARVTDIAYDGVPQEDTPTPAHLRVPLNGTASYRIEGAAMETVREATEAFGPGAAYDWVSLLNRSRSMKVKLSVNLGPIDTEPFAAAMDLTSGKERPLPMQRGADGRTVTIEVEDCPARTLLRVYWPLRTEGPARPGP